MRCPSWGVGTKVSIARNVTGIACRCAAQLFKKQQCHKLKVNKKEKLNNVHFNDRNEVLFVPVIARLPSTKLPVSPKAASEQQRAC